VNLRRIVVVIAVLIAAVLAGVALFGSKSLDIDDLESDLAGQAAPELGTTAEAMDVSCPDDVDVEAGTTFECEVSYEESGAGQPAADGTATIEIELTDDDGTYIPRLTP
jgi:Domain of unknown function (DUF4333)